MLEFLKKLFEGSSDAAQRMALDEVLEYTVQQIRKPELISDYINKYERGKSLNPAQRKTVYVPLYFAIEDFIVNNKPPVVAKLYTKQQLRQAIAQAVDTQKLDPAFQLIFLPEQSQLLGLYEYGVAYLVNFFKHSTGFNALIPVLKDGISGTIMSSEAIQPDGIHFEVLNVQVAKLSSEDVINTFRKLNGILNDHAVQTMGVAKAQELFDALYATLTGNLDYNLIAAFLDALPHGVLEDEKIKFLSRAEFERRLRERTLDLDEARRQLEAKVADYDKGQAALVNLLEDARELETQLRTEQDRMHAIIESVAEGIYVVDTKLQFLLLNTHAETLLALKSTDVLGKDKRHFMKAFRGNDQLTDEELPSMRVIKSGEAYNVGVEDNIFYQNSEGKRFPVTISAAPLRSEGNITGAVVIFRDATVEKKLDEAKTGFISIASHQLRTPLTSMRWFSEMLMDGDAGDLTEDQKHFVERIYQGTDRMINLVNLLLQIARVEAGRVKIEPVPVDLVATTQGVALTLKANLEQKSQQVLIKTIPEKIPSVLMDYDVIWQVIQNLLSNASRYSPEKGVIDVGITLKSEEQLVEYAVKDHGIGIPPDQRDRIFEKFYRATNAVQAVPEGSGLGLSLVRSLVEDWGGKVWFESEVGKGTTFFFTIPLTGVKARSGEVKLAV